MKFKVDPEIAELFEPLDKRTYEGLKKLIQRDGIRDPLIVAEDGTIVCGHQRYKIAQELGIDPPYKVRPFKDRWEMIEYAIEDNIDRRQLNTYQKGLVALRFLEFEEKAARERTGTRTDLMDETSVKDFTNVRGRSDVKASQRVGISHATLRKVRYVEENGSEELRQKARKGEVTVEAAFLEVRARELGEPHEAFKTPRLRVSKTLYPIKSEKGDYIIATDVPKDWYRGVKVTIEPELKESLIARAKEAHDEEKTRTMTDEFENVTKQVMSEFDERVRKRLEKENIEIEARRQQRPKTIVRRSKFYWVSEAIEKQKPRAWKGKRSWKKFRIHYGFWVMAFFKDKELMKEASKGYGGQLSMSGRDKVFGGDHEELGEMYVAFYSDSKVRLKENKERLVQFFRDKGAVVEVQDQPPPPSRLRSPHLTSTPLF